MTAPTARRTTRSSTPARATDRFEIRLRSDAKATIVAAAAALGMDTSDFARDVLLERASEVLAERAVTTTVPAFFFDELITALDEPARANDALRKATAAARQSMRAEHLHP